MTAFVFGGGGNLGASQVGMLIGLFEAGIIPDVVLGCSVGALNAAACAGDPSLAGAQAMARRWVAVTSKDIFPARALSGPWHLALPGESLYSNAGLLRVITSWVPFRTFEQAHVPLHVVATSLRAEREVWFSSGEIARPLLASAALPAVYPPVAIGGDMYIDGGVVDNVPISRAIELGAKRIYVLHVGNFSRPRPDPRRPLDVLLHAFSIGRNHRFASDVANVPDDVELIVLPGVDPGPLKYTDFSKSRTLIDRAWRAARDFLSAPVASGS